MRLIWGSCLSVPIKDLRSNHRGIFMPLPFNLESAFSIATWISLLSTAVDRSRFVNVEAFSSHRFLDKVNTTTGSKAFFFRRPIRWT